MILPTQQGHCNWMKRISRNPYTFSMTLMLPYRIYVGEILHWKILEAMEKIQQAMSTIQGNFSYMVSDKDQLYELVHMLHGASLNDDAQICKLSNELMATQDSLRSTQISLLESKMEIQKFHQELHRSHIPSYILVIHSPLVDGIQSSMDEPHDMVVHEVHDGMHVFEELWDTDDESHAHATWECPPKHF